MRWSDRLLPGIVLLLMLAGNYTASYGVLYSLRRPAYDSTASYWVYPMADDVCWIVYRPAYEAHKFFSGTRWHNHDRRPFVFVPGA